jgi:1-acyl-sn-glycerol-3-phosphate acyltransferase
MLNRILELPQELLERLKDLDPVDLWAKSTSARLAEPSFQRDERFLQALLPVLELLSRYFDGEVRGLENAPEQGPMLLVGNHSGAPIVPDFSVLVAAWYRERGLDSPLFGLTFDAAFGVPGFDQIVRKIGGVPANHDNAERALDERAAVIVYPGGFHEAFRPWSDRNKIDFAGHKGFVRLALRHQVPVVPVVSHGSHNITVVLARGDWLAQKLRLSRVRFPNVPIVWQIPWGLSIPFVPGVPLPAKVTVQVCEAVDWSAFGPDDADDPEVVDRCYEEITGVMQATLDGLVRERPYPLLSRLRSLLPGA